jgi:hypothetical protein
MASKNSGFTSKNGRGSINNSGLTSQVMQFFRSKLHEAKIWGPNFMSSGPEWCCRLNTNLLLVKSPLLLFSALFMKKHLAIISPYFPSKSPTI